MPDAQQLAAQLAAIHAQQASMAAAVTALTSSTQEALHQMQNHLASVSAGVAALAGTTTLGCQQQPVQHLQQHLASLNAGMAALAVDSMAAEQQVHSVLAGAAGPPARPRASPKRLSSLHRSYQALEQLQAHHFQQPPGQQRAAGCAPALETSDGPDSPSGLATTWSAQGLLQAPCWRDTYAQLLSGGGPTSDQQLQLRLLRCMAKSGPVWEQLDASIGQQLIHHCLSAGKPAAGCGTWQL